MEEHLLRDKKKERERNNLVVTEDKAVIIRAKVHEGRINHPSIHPLACPSTY